MRTGQREVAVATKLDVGNLSYRTEQESLHSLFAQYGEVISAQIVTDRDTGRSRGFGFVEFADQESAEKATRELNGTELDGRNLKVNEARSREERPRRDDYRY